MSKVELPSYDAPPVVETILGIQFEPIPGFTNGHLGSFWSYLGGRDAWPHTNDARAIPQEFEWFGEERKWIEMDKGIRLGLTTIPTTRLQLRNADRDRMVQIQDGHLYYNWLGQDGGQYVRYEKIKREFDDIIQKFRAFLEIQQLPQMQPNQWEVAHTNHILEGTVWSDASDWINVFSPDIKFPVHLHYCALETVNDQWVYEITPQRGRLRVQLQHAWKEPNGHQMLILTLAARGPVNDEIRLAARGETLARRRAVDFTRDRGGEAMSILCNTRSFDNEEPA